MLTGRKIMLSAVCVCVLALSTAAQSNPKTSRVSDATGDPANAFKPGVIRYGATVAETESALAGKCKTMKTRRINPPFLIMRDIKDKQMQIDCDGFEFSGKPRWAEFVFADDSLEMVWILTDAADETSFLKTMTDAYGAPTQRNDKFVAFAVGRAALRLDRPEVLFYSEKLAPRILPWFGKDSTFK